MKIRVIYDTSFGNTGQVATAIAGALTGDVEALRVADCDPSRLATVDLLFVGSPTLGGKPTKAMQALLESLTVSSLGKARAAAFDTRMSAKWVGIFGYAAGAISSGLQAKGAAMLAPPEAFFVKGRTGPLKDGELERAAAWAKAVFESASRSH